LHFDPGSVTFVPQAQIQSQRIGGAPVVLEVQPEHMGALAPGSCTQAARNVRWKSEEKICFPCSTSVAGLGQSVRTRGELSGEIHASGSAVVTRVEDIELM